MNGVGKSDDRVVPEKSPNKDRARARSAEGMEERRSAEGNPREQSRRRTQNRVGLKQALDRIRQVARRNRKCQFTTLWHHVYKVERLRACFYALKRGAARGVDGVTWKQYEGNLETNLEDLSGRLQRGAYRAKPVLRVYIPKASGESRPLGIPALEDKIVQRSTFEVLNAIYEEDFEGFSYGFRPGRHQHMALDALSVGIEKKKVNWVLDADIRGFFDTIDHEWLLKFVGHRIADKRVLRHIKKWLKAGVLEDGAIRKTEEGTPQGGIISPLLANIYLHHALDLWVSSWRKREARGEVIIVRYADDFVMGFQHRDEAERFKQELMERLERFGLELHPDKTRLIEFGRFAQSKRKKRNEGRPETFDFLGLTHICGKDRKGWFRIRRKTQRRRLRSKLQEIKRELRRRLHWKLKVVGRWLKTVLTGHYNYYGVPLNIRSLASLRYQVMRSWLKTLRRRSQRTKQTWKRYTKLVERWLPRARITHRWPNERLRV